jgi:hypothetical protein
MAAISDYELRVLPKPKSIFDFLREGMGGEETDSVRLRVGQSGLFATGSPLFDTVLPMLRSLDPQRAKVLTQALIRLKLIHEEQVILMTPQDMLIRFK